MHRVWGDSTAAAVVGARSPDAPKPLWRGSLPHLSVVRQDAQVWPVASRQRRSPVMGRMTPTDGILHDRRWRSSFPSEDWGKTQ